jgi:hypothetical protein
MTTGARQQQMPLEYKGKHYAGVFSVSGGMLIARIPGINSKSAEMAGNNPEEKARSLLNAILVEAEQMGRL